MLVFKSTKYLQIELLFSNIVMNIFAGIEYTGLFLDGIRVLESLFLED